MKTPQQVLAAAIEEAIELARPEAFDGSLALRRLSDAGFEIRPRIGEVRVAPADMSHALMLAQASAQGFDVVYGDEDLDRFGFVEAEAAPAEETAPRSWGDVIGEAINNNTGEPATARRERGPPPFNPEFL